MKRISLILIALGIALCGHAQTDTAALAPSDNKSFAIDLGLSAGASLYNNGNDNSPYYSRHGFFLQLPLMAHWQFAPHWKLSSGLRYDFVWSPLCYAVEPVGASFGNYYDQGLQFRQTPTTASQHTYAYQSYLGIPIELKWYPNAQHRNALGIALDLFAAYAVTQYFSIEAVNPPELGGRQGGYDYSSYNAMNPWKLEVGFTLSTSLLGLVHGIRFSANLLPTYSDPLTDEKVYTSAISLFL